MSSFSRCRHSARSSSISSPLQADPPNAPLPISDQKETEQNSILHGMHACVCILPIFHLNLTVHIGYPPYIQQTRQEAHRLGYSKCTASDLPTSGSSIYLSTRLGPKVSRGSSCEHALYIKSCYTFIVCPSLPNRFFPFDEDVKTIGICGLP